MSRASGLGRVRAQPLLAAALYHVPVWLAGIYLHGAPLLIAVARGSSLGPSR